MRSPAVSPARTVSARGASCELMQVQLDGDHVRVVDAEQLDEAARERWTVERSQVLPVFVMGVDGHHIEPRTADEPEDRLRQRVVHQRIEPVAGHPFGRRLPDLADEVGVGPHGATALAERRPERRVVDLGRHVKPPAVDAESQPVLTDRQQVLAHVVVARVQLRQRGQAPPRLVAEPGPARRVARRIWQGVAPSGENLRVEMEPVAVRRRGTVLEDVVERPEAPPRVVEDAIEDDPHAPLVGDVEQLAKGTVPAQQRIDMEVVVRVVAMVRRRLEDRREIDRRDTELVEVVEVLDHAQQVAALEAMVGRWCVPRLERPRLRHARTRGEPVGEDLVEDGIADPVRRLDRHGRHPADPMRDSIRCPPVAPGRCWLRSLSRSRPVPDRPPSASIAPDPPASASSPSAEACTGSTVSLRARRAPRRAALVERPRLLRGLRPHLRRLGRRRHRRSARSDRPARLPQRRRPGDDQRPRRDRALADADRRVAELPRLRRRRLPGDRARLRDGRRLQARSSRRRTSAASRSSSTWS